MLGDLNPRPSGCKPDENLFGPFRRLKPPFSIPDEFSIGTNNYLFAVFHGRRRVADKEKLLMVKRIS